MKIERYPNTRIATSWGNPLDDLLVQLQFLRARDYVAKLATEVHGVPKSKAINRADLIASHVRASQGFIDQSFSGNAHTAFLPLYYAVLNLLKVYILLRRSPSDLQKNRWHGATYDVYGKNSHSLLTEVVTLRSGGAIPLFYEVVTGEKVKDKTRIKLADICPLVKNATAEWQQATGELDVLAPIRFDITKSESNEFKPRAKVWNPDRSPFKATVRRLQVLNGFTKIPGDDGHFEGKPLSSQDSIDEFRNQLRPELLYCDPSGKSETPIDGRSLLWPEELPIVLVLFYMSSVTRYRPDFLEKLADSKYWPYLATVRSHAITKFLFLLSSFVHQENVYIVPTTDVERMIPWAT